MKLVPRVIVSTAIILILDFIYFSVNKNAFETQIVEIQRVFMQIKILPVILCYILLVFGLNYFILRNHRSIFDAFLLGVVIYGVYDMTNLATLKKWKWNLAIMDTLWGGVLLALTTAIIYAF